MKPKTLVSIWLILITLLAIRFYVHFTSLPDRIDGRQIEIQGVIDSEPTRESHQQKFSQDGLAISTTQIPAWHYGDEVAIRGILNCYDSFKCVRAGVNKAEVTLVKPNQTNPILKLGHDLRLRVKDTYYNSLPNNQANLLAGIVLGSLDLDRQFKTELANVGLSHVVAASGMNITLFVIFITSLFTFFHLPVSSRVILSLLAVIFYSTITGFSPSVVRAAVMFGAGMIGLLFGRRNSIVGGVITAAYLMLWVNPQFLFDYGFLLSFASLIGQVILSDIKLRVPAILQSLGQITIQTFGAISFTLPIIIIGFTRFSLISMITNILVLWTVEPLMFLGGLAGIIGLVLPEPAKLVLLPAGPLLSYFLWVVKIFSADVFVLKVENFNLTMAIGYYLILYSTIYIIKHHKTTE